MLTKIITSLVLLASVSSALAAELSVTLAWDAAPVEGVVYRIHYGMDSRVYVNSLDAGTNLTLTVSNLAPGIIYFFAATARFAMNPSVESEFSNEVYYQVPPVLAPPRDVGFIIENGKVVLTWGAPVVGSGVTRYKIYHAMGTEIMTFFAITTNAIPRFELGILAAGHHRWAITAQQDGLIESALSEEVDFWKAPVPTGLVITQTGLVIVPPPDAVIRIQKPP